MTFQDIADEIGYSGPGAAKAAVERGLQNKGLPLEEARMMVDLELARLDEMSQPYYLAGKNGDRQAGEFWLKISERRTKLAGSESLKIEMFLARAPKVETTITRGYKALVDILAEIDDGIDADNDPTDKALLTSDQGLTTLNYSRTTRR